MPTTRRSDGKKEYNTHKLKNQKFVLRRVDEEEEKFAIKNKAMVWRGSEWDGANERANFI